ncbi:MAG: hypothetical protein ACLQVF_25785 [Isosphaeraceae bacterium]
MFPVTRPVRQALATLAVIALTMAPTGYVAILAWRINRPGHVRDVEIELGRQLGLQVTLHGVHYPRPGEVVYEGIVLRQDEPRGRSLAEVARADRVRVERVDRELILQLENVQVHAESPKMALDRLSTLLRISGQGAFDKVNLTAPACQIELGQAGLSFSLTDLAGEFQADPATPTCRLAYRFPDEGGGTRCETTLTRDRRADPPQTSLVFRTVEGLPLPARVLDCFFDSRDWLGDNAQVEGTLSLRKIGSQDWEAEFQGDLHDVNLSNLVGKRFPRHLLTGRAHVAFRSARWGLRPNQGMGWVAVIGELSAGQGTIGVNLLAALAREMKFRLSPRLANLDPRKTEVDFRALGLSFAIEPNGEIRVAGALGSEFGSDAVLAGGTTSLLSAPAGTANVHGLIKTLFPSSPANPDVLIPLTAESRVLLSLPVPGGAEGRARRTVDGN